MQIRTLKNSLRKWLRPYLFPTAQLALAAGILLSRANLSNTDFLEGLCFGLSLSLNLGLMIQSRYSSSHKEQNDD